MFYEIHDPEELPVPLCYGLINLDHFVLKDKVNVLTLE